MAKVSIVIPIYNVEKYLEQCLDSVINQTFSDIEIILVDDKSPDGCPEICERYAKNDKRITVVHHEENVGTNGAVISGISAATAEFIMFADSDDCVAADYIEKHYNAIVENDADCVVTGFVSFNNKGEKKPEFYEEKSYNKQQIKTKIIYDFFNVSVSLTNTIGNSRWAKIYKTEKLKLASKGCNPKLCMGEDAELNIRFLILSEKVVVIPGYAGYFYRRDNVSSATLQQGRKKYKIYRLYLDVINKLAIELGQDARIISTLLNRIHNEIMHDITIVLNGNETWKERCNEIDRELNDLFYTSVIEYSSNEMFIYLSANITNEQKMELCEKIVARIEIVDLETVEKNYYYTNFIFRFLESSLPVNLRIQKAKQFKKKFSNKRYLFEFAKDQSIMGKLSCLLIYLGLERLLVTLIEIKRK